MNDYAELIEKGTSSYYCPDRNDECNDLLFDLADALSEVLGERDAALVRAESAEQHMYVLNECVLKDREEHRAKEAAPQAEVERLGAVLAHIRRAAQSRLDDGYEELHWFAWRADRALARPEKES